ncbi:hypothetical protein [Nocardiopsis dassonvillei]|uniref:hypothetical protein n=1 Tax=Nocardiopsis dassonvillei TaxID=2014 RepID=UPI003F569F9A
MSRQLHTLSAIRPPVSTDETTSISRQRAANGDGWKLAPDPETVKVLARIIRDVLDGRSLTAAAMALNNAGTPVPRGHQAIKAGREPGGVRADWLDAYTTDRFLKHLGPMPMTEIVTHKGYDPTPGLGKVENELRALYADKGTRRSRTGRKIWQEEIDALERRAEALEAAPRIEARTEAIGTGETYAMFRERHDVTGRRRLLRDSGARVAVTKGRSGGGAERLKGPDEKRLAFTVDAHTAPEAAESEGKEPDEP